VRQPNYILLPLLSALLSFGAAPPKPTVAQDVIDRYASVWNRLRSYTCTWTVHERKGNRVQDRVYRVFFQKPLNTRVEIADGDGKGSVAIWTGGDRVRGHQGGILSVITLNVDLHSRLAVTLRGATVAQVNMGSLLSHLQSIGARNFNVEKQGEDSVLTARVHDPPPDTDALVEEFVFSPDGLPIESFQYGAGNIVLKHVTVSDYKLNVTLPPSTWQI
jgi:hypothetical protein